MRIVLWLALLVSPPVWSSDAWRFARDEHACILTVDVGDRRDAVSATWLFTDLSGEMAAYAGVDVQMYQVRFLLFALNGEADKNAVFTGKSLDREQLLYHRPYKSANSAALYSLSFRVERLLLSALENGEAVRIKYFFRPSKYRDREVPVEEVLALPSSGFSQMKKKFDRCRTAMLER